MKWNELNGAAWKADPSGGRGWVELQLKPENIVKLPLNVIANLVRQDWKNVWFGAVPYLEAMSTLDEVNPRKCEYGLDSGTSIVAYFLSNANSWRGETARQVKKELNRRLKGGK